MKVSKKIEEMTKSKRQLFITFTLLLITSIKCFTLVMAVDRSKFRTCSQTSFCRRHRNGRSKPIYKYKLDPESIAFHPEITPSADGGEGNDVGMDVSGSSSGSGTTDTNQNVSNVNSENNASSNGGMYQTLKNMFSLSPSSANEKDPNKNKVMDPYIRGPKPFFTAQIVNEAKLTSTGSSERLNLALHLHDNGIARVRITEEYYDPSATDTASSDSDSSSSNRNHHNIGLKNKPYANARWTSDELILNIDEMKSATVVSKYDHTSDDGIVVLKKLLANVDNSAIDDKEDNFVAFKYGQMNAVVKEESKCDTSSSLVLIQFEPFALHLFRDECSSGADDNYGKPIVSVNTENLMHFEIRRLKEAEEEKAEKEIDSSSNNNNGNPTTDSAKELEEPVEEEDRHGGKEIVGYWEDGLAIYADGTREERKEDTIIAEKRRILAEEERESNNDNEFHFDNDGMWEESFGPHKDSKPYGPMSVGADITFPSSRHIFGLPEHASSTQLKGTTGEGAHYKEPYRLYNLDVFEYELDETMALYGEAPLIVSQSKSSGSVGVFWFNPSETFVDVENTGSGDGDSTRTHWISESGVIDLFLLPGPNPKSLYHQYATLTGRMPLPPMWSLGYHQCRWNYRDEADVYAVHGKFEELDYPYDVLWLDIEHTDGKKYFTWDKNLFPDPISMQEKLKSQGRNMVTIIDPHIKRDDNYNIHKKATEKGLYIKDKDGQKDFDGWCWPGSSSYLDFTNSVVRRWWAEQFGYDKYIGSTSSLFTWNDMNEPSVFNGPEVSMQKDLRNLDGIEHREWHNLYGILFQRATAEGLILRNAEQNVRPFVLSRSFFAGSQRYGAIWTGDNESSWSHLQIAAPMLLSLNTAALSFVGADVGGFFGNPDAELMTRWMQAGAYQPFFRGHAHHDAKRREPWVFGDEWMVKMRHAAMTRYALLPYWYTVFREAGVTGMPVMRTMWMQYPNVEGLYGTDDQYLIGSDILVKPVTAAGVTQTEVKFPLEDKWYDVDSMTSIKLSNNNESMYESLKVSSEIDKIPVYQRGGSIIARKLRLRRSTQLMINDPYTLYIALDKESNNASGTLYMDDENTFDHERKGYYAVANLTVDMKNFIRNDIQTADAHSGEWLTEELKNSRMVERIIIMGVEKTPSEMKLGESDLSFSYDESSKVMVVRKPNISAMNNWEITLKY